MTREPSGACSTVAYGGDNLLDIYRPFARPVQATVLLWHGSGPDERDVFAPIATQLRSAGLAIVVPDWQSDDDRQGGEQLLQSVAFTVAEMGRSGTSQLILGGWSRGANAAADLVFQPKLLGTWRPTAFLGLAGSYDGSPFSTSRSAADIEAAPVLPGLVVHGAEDQIVPPTRSVALCRDLRKLGWPVEYRQVDTDHAGVIGCRYDPVAKRCVATTDLATSKVVGLIARCAAALVSAQWGA